MRCVWPCVAVVCALAGLTACAPRDDAAERAATPLPIASRETARDSVAAMAARLHVPGVAIASVRDGTIEWTLGSGVTRAGGEPVTDSTVFEAASLGKPLFAYGVARLAAAGRIDLFTPLARYLPDSLRGAALDSAVTAARVLSHTSGLAFDETARRFVLEFRPGDRWKYSAAGYRLLQRAVEHVTGLPLEAWIQAEVCGPLAMTRTSYLGGTPGAATGHTRDGSALAANAAREPDAASTLHTTAGDYAKFVVATFGTEEMWAPRGMVSPELQLGWGLGWGVAGPRPPAFLHWGSNPGFKALAMGIPGYRSGFVVLTNGDHGLELATALAPLLLGHEYGGLSFFMLHPGD
jgi:CubicO group peptidase (beta-lactamase class C family)